MGIDPEKLFVLFVIALIVLGPERLPKMARSLGRGLAELRKYSATARAEMDEVLAEPRAAVRSALQDANLEDLAGFASLRSPLRYIDAMSRPRGDQAALDAEGDGAAGALPGQLGDNDANAGLAAPAGAGGSWVAMEPSDLPLPDDPALN
jgi:Tat protein translocase TatB subunit